jgi:exopolysaccharide production protein ExoQ
LDSDALMDLVALICGLSAVASVVQFFIFPELGDFRGIFSQKNVLGQVMAGGVLAALHGARIRGGRRFRYICIIALCTIVAFMSKSATSILTIVVFFWLDILGRLYLRGGSFRIISICLAIVCVPIVIFFVTNADSIFELFGKDSTLTGRTMFWPFAIDNISKKPLLGWGFHAFWSPLNPIVAQIDEAIRGDNWYTFYIVNAHNGMLELLLDIGFVGTSFFIFLWLRNFVMAVKCMNGPARQFGLSSVLLLIGIFLVGVSEVVLNSAGQIWTSL